jgi:sugar phosphate permease
MTEKATIKVYGYRWVVLLVFAIVNVIMQMHWVNFAPITSEAAAFYGVSPLKIGFLSMCFLIVYLFICIPASYIIDTYGIRIGIGIGVVLTGIFGLLKGIYPTSYLMICISQIGISVAQPFILNAITKVAANWFPLNERATAAGVATLSQFIGIIVAMVLTPYLLKTYSMGGMLMDYGILTAISTIIFLLLMREKPPTPPSHITEEERIKVFAGIRHIFKLKDMLILLLIFFIGLGMFNAVTTWIEQILAPRGFNSEQAGLIGAAMMIGGILGASIMAILSDKLRKRKPFILITLIGQIPGLIGLTFITSYPLLLFASFVLGFFIVGAAPVGFQYGAEVSYPAPESTAQGLIMLSGQISGIIFIYGMDMFRSATTHSMTPFMIVFVVLAILNVLVASFMKESKLITAKE